MPMLFVGFAAISPATNVPCPCSSVYGEPPTNDFAATTRPLNSGCEPSIPESITATLTGKSCGSVGQKLHASSCSRYHCFAASGSVLSNAGRGRRQRERERREQEERRAASRDRQRRRQPRREPVPGRDADAIRPGRASAAVNDQAPAASVAAVATRRPGRAALLLQLHRRVGDGRLDRPLHRAARDGVPSTRAATATFARPARTLCHASRYCVAACGLTIVENAPSPPSSTSPTLCQSVPAVFASSVTASAPRAKPVSETAPP